MNLRKDHYRTAKGELMPCGFLGTDAVGASSRALPLSVAGLRL